MRASRVARLELDDVEKVFANGARAIHRLSLEAADGELLVLLGPSGCGKSTLMRMVAGLEQVSAGEIRIAGEVVNDRTPQQRNVAMVFQNYALYPHMSVRANLEFPLHMRRLAKAEIRRRVHEAARALDLTALLERRPRELSGGQRQRVAMGRAIVRDPSVFLMDEPLSNLDAKLRVQIRGEIAALQRRMGATTLYVTHDQVEAMTLGQRVAVLRAGALQQVATPQELYDRPANVFVAGFLGSPPMNLFRPELGEERGERVLRMAGRPLVRLDAATAEAASRAWLAGLRPEGFRWPAQRPDLPTAEVAVLAVEALGHEQLVFFTAPVEVADPDAGPAATLIPAGQGTLAARLDAHRPVQPGDRLTLAVDAARLHWFDREGRVLRRP